MVFIYLFIYFFNFLRHKLLVFNDIGAVKSRVAGFSGETITGAIATLQHPLVDGCGNATYSFAPEELQHG